MQNLDMVTLIMRCNEVLINGNIVLFKDKHGKIYGRVMNKRMKQAYLQ